MQNSKKAKSWKTALLMVLAFFLVMAALAAAGLVPHGRQRAAHRLAGA